MRKSGPRKLQDINGIGIYHDPKHGTVYYDFFTKRAFNLTTQDTQMCLYYTALFPLAIIISLALTSFMKIRFVPAFGIGIGAYILAEILFRVLYFYKLPEVKDYKPIKKEKYIISFAKKYSIQRLIVLAILAIIVAVCTYLYGKVTVLENYSIVGGYILSAVCVGIAIFSLIALAIKKKNNY